MRGLEPRERLGAWFWFMAVLVLMNFTFALQGSMWNLASGILGVALCVIEYRKAKKKDDSYLR